MFRRTGSAPEPDAQLLELLREVRHRIRSGDPERFLSRLHEEPAWVAALPEQQAKVARTVLEASREFARRAIAEKRAAPPAAAFSREPKALPRRTSEQEARNLALAQRAEELDLAACAPSRRKR